ncbi:MAG: hypothetical protein M3Z25_16540 [Actinomycetota bacterium]|nr:hypothetical protein [Actinomycetota bacterium]
MNKRIIKMAAVGVMAAGLAGWVSAPAWADTFTPAIEEPTLGYGLLMGPASTGTPADGGNHSSAEGRNGSDYNSRTYSDGGYSDGGYSGRSSGDGYSGNSNH